MKSALGPRPLLEASLGALLDELTVKRIWTALLDTCFSSKLRRCRNLIEEVMEEPELGRSVKIMILGDRKAGKTALLMTRYMDPISDYVPRLHDPHYECAVIGGRRVSLSTWDASIAAEDTEADRVRPLSYAYTTVFVLLYSAVDKASFENVVQKWIPEVRQFMPEVPFLIAGSRLDLRPGSKASVGAADVKAAANKYGATSFLEYSATTREGLAELWTQVLRIAGDGTPTPCPHRPKCILL